MDPNIGHEQPWPSRDEVESLSARFLSLMTRAHCSACNGYYGLAFDQPVCPTCHAFLYANVHDAEINLQLVINFHLLGKYWLALHTRIPIFPAYCQSCKGWIKCNNIEEEKEGTRGSEVPALVANNSSL